MIYRNYFGTWGRELSDGDFACALAALGVAESLFAGGVLSPMDERVFFPQEDLVKPVEWRLFTNFSVEARRGDASARNLAEWWKGSNLFGKARIEVDRSSHLEGVDSMAMLTWIVGELSRPDVGARSVYLRVDRPSVTVGWRWPIRVGFLGDAESQALKKRLDKVIRAGTWMRPLVSLIGAEGSRSSCDLLLLPGGVRQSLAMAAGVAKPVRADCVIVLGRAEGDAAHWSRMIEGLRAAVRTSGVAVAQRGTADIEDWFKGVVRQLSHNKPIDVALFGAVDNPAAQPPFVAISRRLAEFSRISMQMFRTAKRLRRPGVREATIEFKRGSPEARTADGGGGVRTLDAVADRLEATAAMGESMVDPEGFMHEHDVATGSARVEMATADAAPSPAAQQERVIQARVFDLSSPAEVRLRHRFRAGANHRIAVRIGDQDDEEWISDEVGPVFPVDSLPQDQDEWELTAVLSVAQSSDDPQVSRLFLKRFGNSSDATFFLYVKEEWKDVEARIIVLHRSRVVQTKMIKGRVGGGADIGDDNDRITVESEVMARTRFDNLGARERFDAALVINKSTAGIDRILALSDDNVAKLDPGPTLSAEIDTIDEMLAEIVNEPRAYMGKLTSKPVVDLLRSLAQHGNVLYDHLVRDGGLAKVGLDGDGPLQVISAVADARLPIELVYDRRAPTATAKMCPGAAASLRRGKCAASCSRLEKQSAFICPLAFWGVRRVIERHAHDSDLRKATTGSEFAVVSEPTDIRPTLALLKRGLVAGSQKVEKSVPGGLGEICAIVGKLTSSTLKPVRSWKSWTKNVGKAGPSLLVLLVHTEEPMDSNIPQMEIGKASWLPLEQLEHEHVVRKNGAPPLVLLLGCETGVSNRQFANFVNRVRNRGAAIVVATGATIHALHAVPVAKEFVTRIQEAAGEDGDATFGEVMLAVRRQMLAAGMPMVLTLNAYGDADWRLAKQT